MSLVKTAREALGMSQSEFAAWLAKETGREQPYPTPRISEYENGRKNLRVDARRVCLEVVVKHKDLSVDVSELL